ncbi:MAG: hypothetical protein JXC85_06570 [Candidatus Aenigmarchaeota archaeon]|nr:hypothetical protein [Candidatus Aenigmarchaeota archaeon]
MSNGRMSIRSIYTDILRGEPIDESQEQFIVDAVDPDNMGRIAWELVALGSGGWEVLKRIALNTPIDEVRDYVSDVLSEKQADKPSIQIKNTRTFPAMRLIYDKAGMLGSNFYNAKQRICMGAKPETVLAKAYA